jgi:hypothetical protein
MMNSYSLEMKAQLRLMCMPTDVLARSFEEGISETVVVNGRGLRGLNALILEWEMLNRVLLTFNRSTNPGELKKLQVRR